MSFTKPLTSVSSSGATAKEVHQIALIGGELAKKGKSGGWKKRMFFLTQTKWMYYDSKDAKIPKDVMSVEDVLSVEVQATSNVHIEPTVFCVTSVKKKQILKAKSMDERDRWINAISKILVKFGRLPDESTIKSDAIPMNELHLVARDMARGIGVSSHQQKFVLRAVYKWLQSTKALNYEKAQSVVKSFLETKIIVACDGSVDGYELRAEDVDVNCCFGAVVPLKPGRKHGKSDKFENESFDVKEYVDKFFQTTKFTEVPNKCDELRKKRDISVKEMKEGVRQNYLRFIHAASSIQEMEDDVDTLKKLIDHCGSWLQTLGEMNTKQTLLSPPEILTKPSTKVKKNDDLFAQAIRMTSNPLYDQLYTMEAMFHRREYESLTDALLKLECANPSEEDLDLARQISDLQAKMISKLTDDFDTCILHLRRRRSTFVGDLEYQDDQLGQRGRCHDSIRKILALLFRNQQHERVSQLCFGYYRFVIQDQVGQTRSIQMSSSQRIYYVFHLSRAFYSSLLHCAREYQKLFQGEKLKYLSSLIAWITREVATFGDEIFNHVFDHPGTSFRACTLNVLQYRLETKFITNCLKYLFHGARQLELDGLPIAHTLTHTMQSGLVAFVKSYAATIQVFADVLLSRPWNYDAIRCDFLQEIQQEKWMLNQLTLRTSMAEKHGPTSEKSNKSVICLSKSAQLCYELVQQLTKDINRLVPPSFPTSHTRETKECMISNIVSVPLHYVQTLCSMIEKMTSSGSFASVYKELLSISLILQSLKDDLFERIASEIRFAHQGMQNRNDVKQFTECCTYGRNHIGSYHANYFISEILQWSDLGKFFASIKGISMITFLHEANENVPSLTGPIQMVRWVTTMKHELEKNTDPSNAKEFLLQILCFALYEVQEDRFWNKTLATKSEENGAIDTDLVRLNYFIAQIKVLLRIFDAEAEEKVAAQFQGLMEQVHKFLRKSLQEGALDTNKHDMIQAETGMASSKWIDMYIAKVLDLASKTTDRPPAP